MTRPTRCLLVARHAVLLLALLSTARVRAQARDAGRNLFDERCAPCYGTNGAGSALAGSILERLRALDDAAVASVMSRGRLTAARER